MSFSTWKELYYPRAKAVAGAVAVQGTGILGVLLLLEGIREYSQPAALIAAGLVLVAWTVMKVRNP